MEVKDNLAKFRDILRTGIGTRTQKEFAEATGISKEYLNRILNNKEKSTPSLNTLMSISRCITNASLDELLASCGREPLSDKELSGYVEGNIDKAVRLMLKETGTIWDSVQDAIDTLNLLYMEDGKVIPENLERSECAENTSAEYYSLLSVKWADSERVFYTVFKLYYAELKSGKILVAGTSLPEEQDENIPSKKVEQITHHTYAVNKEDISAEKRLLEAIFGNVVRKEPFTYVGYGFCYNETPAGFRDFMIQHAGTFCASVENRILYQRLIDTDDDPDVIFQDYESVSNGTSGTAMAVADILRKETGCEFDYFEKNESNEISVNSYIMIPCKDNLPDKIPKDILIKLYEIARELKVPKFGLCYYHTVQMVEKDDEYDTENFYLKFRK